jgi:hypothetical protein
MKIHDNHHSHCYENYTSYNENPAATDKLVWIL